MHWPLGRSLRTYFEVERFDRVGHDGRVGVISLFAIDAEDARVSAAFQVICMTCLHALESLPRSGADVEHAGAR